MNTRILEKPLKSAKSFFLLGPRGTGKTSWVRTNLPHVVYLDLLDAELYATLLANPHRLMDYIPKDYRDWIVIDEVQRIPELLNEVHRLIELGHIFVLTGSSARNLRKKGVNLLAGRALVYHMHPMTFQEMGAQFDLEKVLSFGLLPAILSEPDPKAYLKAYVGTYLREEVLQEGLTRNLSAFSRFLEVASFSQGQVLNMSSVAREANVRQKTVSDYFDILTDLLLSYRLPVFTKRAKRQTIQHPKFYFFDIGVYQILRPRGLIDSDREIEGAALETLFLQSLLALNDYYELDYQIYYWRTVAGVEVDFIIYGEKGFYAFEVKRTHNPSVQDIKGLKAFQKEYPAVTPYLVYCGEYMQKIAGIDVFPIKEILQKLLEIIG